MHQLPSPLHGNTLLNLVQAQWHLFVGAPRRGYYPLAHSGFEVARATGAHQHFSKTSSAVDQCPPENVEAVATGRCRQSGANINEEYQKGAKNTPPAPRHYPRVEGSYHRMQTTTWPIPATSNPILKTEQGGLLGEKNRRSRKERLQEIVLVALVAIFRCRQTVRSLSGSCFLK